MNTDEYKPVKCDILEGQLCNETCESFNDCPHENFDVSIEDAKSTFVKRVIEMVKKNE